MSKFPGPLTWGLIARGLQAGLHNIITSVSASFRIRRAGMHWTHNICKASSIVLCLLCPKFLRKKRYKLTDYFVQGDRRCEWWCQDLDLGSFISKCMWLTLTSKIRWHIPTIQWLSTFLMLLPFHIVPHIVMISPPNKIILLPFHNCNVAIVVNCTVNI